VHGNRVTLLFTPSPGGNPHDDGRLPSGRTVLEVEPTCRGSNGIEREIAGANDANLVGASLAAAMGRSF